MADDDTRPGSPDRITDLAALKVFTHPLRLELWRALNAARTATASQLADQVDEAVSLVSYHLRKMAEHGFIEEAEGRRRDGRERWWKPSTEHGFEFRSSDFDDHPEGAAVVSQVTRRLVETRSERYTAYLDQQHAWPREWTNAAFTSEYQARLTAAELRELAEEIAELGRRWAARGQAAEAAGDASDAAEREHVALHLYGFPFRP